MDAAFLQSKHDAGLTYDDYISTGTPDQKANWLQLGEQASLTDTQRKLVGSFVRRINVIALMGIWCGDCSQQGPLIQRVAEANPESVNVRWLDRDEHADLASHVRINAGARVPVLIFCAEDFELVGWYGDKTLSRYRRVARQQLGDSCPLPGAPVPYEELNAALTDWLNEIERVHLLLRLSGRLRKKHGD